MTNACCGNGNNQNAEGGHPQTVLADKPADLHRSAKSKTGGFRPPAGVSAVLVLVVLSRRPVVCSLAAACTPLCKAVLITHRVGHQTQHRSGMSRAPLVLFTWGHMMRIDSTMRCVSDA